MATIFLTGATSGIGKALCLRLIKDGHTVYGTGRSAEKLKALSDAAGSTRFHPVTMNLASFKSIDAALSTHSNVLTTTDILINNAGATSADKQMTEDGFEMQLQVNHLAVVYLTHRFFKGLKANNGMVITTSSDAHRRTHFKEKALRDETRYKIFKRYQETKLYNLIFSYYLDRVYGKQPTRFYAVHPGLVKTDLGAKNASWFVDKMWKLFSATGQPPEGPVPTYLKLINERPAEFVYYAYERPNHHLPEVEDERIQETLMTHALDALKIKTFGETE